MWRIGEQYLIDGERLYMLSTDYPHYDADSFEGAFPPSIPETLRTRIRYQNAIETYPRLAGLLS